MNLKSVESSLNGFISIHKGLILYEKSKILLRADNDRTSKKVKLISGGGAGHEPAHSGFVGRGMITAIVSGDIFASPAVEAILNSILLSGDKNSNIILIVTNYTGDRLNFAFAAELAKVKYGYENIKTILVNDDCSIDNSKVRKAVGKRGLCGTVLIHKIAGAMAEKNYKIDEICNICNELLEQEKLFTIGVSFCSKDNSLKNIEIGKGIHGEPGIFFIEYSPDFNEIIEKMISKFGNRIQNGSPICLLINNLGGTSQHLMSLFSAILIEKLKKQFLLEKILQGSFQTSLSQEGITVTILSLEKSMELLLDCLNFETSVPCSEFGCNKLSELKNSVIGKEETEEKLFEEKILEGVSLDEKGVELAKTVLTFICEYLTSAELSLNKMDEECGDGDTGSTLKKGADSILSSLNQNQIDQKHPAKMLQTISEIFQFNVGGTSGVLYGIFFQTSSQSFLGSTISIKTWLKALKNGNKSLMKYGLAEIGDRTMLDSLKNGEICLKKCIEENLDVLSCVEGFAKGCEEAAKKTIDMLPKSGRAAYTFSENSSRKCQFPDSGAHAVEIWSQALFNAFKFVLNKK